MFFSVASKLISWIRKVSLSSPNFEIRDITTSEWGQQVEKLFEHARKVRVYSARARYMYDLIGFPIIFEQSFEVEQF